ncbi:MAG: hsp70 family protein [Caldilineaceae bacterium]|nr:hsp70 family protein [Caldilineaceae bacterium]
MTDYDHRYIIGMDLGTTNSAVAYVDLADEDASRRRIRRFDVPQLVGLGEVAARMVLPSFLYLPGAHDLPQGGAALPWDDERAYVVGEFAREQGARVPGRLVSSAKSWLSHAGVDRTAPILPWGAGDDVEKVSPVTASMRYLQHVREAWNATLAGPDDEDRFEEQMLILTVPASFDEVARELTVTAAHEAGLTRLILLEEPLAAFYAWLSNHEQDWQGIMAPGQLILVCDVGGGTTDFSILGIRAGKTGLRFDRLAVGDHLMLGGDNMDLLLARLMERKLLGQAGKLDAARWHQLVYQCRQAKEQLLSRRGLDDEEGVRITLMGGGGSLIGGTLAGELTQAEIEQVIVEGFFPFVPADAQPDQGRRTGLTELGLPYVQDPAVTRHLAAFWQRFTPFLAGETGRSHVYPDYMLFNGGALTPGALRDRIRTVTRAWFADVTGPDWAPTELHNPRPEAAVAAGAAYYGLVRLGMGVRVGSGTPRSYYVAVTGDAHSANELAAAVSAVCLIPRGVEEGFTAHLDQLDFEALANQPVAFEVYTSSTRLGDKLGDVVRLLPDEVSVLPPIRTVLRYGKQGEARRIPVGLSVTLTEVGTLQLFCESRISGHRWQLQFDVRQAADAGDAAGMAETLDDAVVDEALDAIQAVFGPQGAAAPAQLRGRLEEILELEKEAWPTPLIRKLADALLEYEAGRRRSAEHEARWLNLLGFCLRPGYGDPVDEWRMKRVWKLYFAGLANPRDTQCRTQWWIFWRRAGGGLKAGQQNELYNLVRSYVNPDAKSGKRPGGALPKSIAGGETLEVWMMLANLERMPARTKADLGRRLLAQTLKGKSMARELWALSRLGARRPLYGPVDRVVPPADAGAWAEKLLAANLPPTERTARTLVMLTQRTGDRTRDVEDTLRSRVEQWLGRLDNAERLQEMLNNPESVNQAEEEAYVFGESLPAGLVLV